MADPELVNPVPVDEVPGWASAMATTFLREPDGPEAARRIDVLTRCWEPARAWGARDRGRWVATLRTEERTLSVPGAGEGTGEVQVDALTNVTVSATHRRRGLMSRMLAGSLGTARERGDALSILIAAEWPIYGRFGYAPATLSASYVLRTGRPGASVAGDPARVRQVERDAFADLAPAVHAAARRRHAGQIDRGAIWWNRMFGRDGYAPLDELPHNWFVHEGDDGPDGLLAWKGDGQWGLMPPFAKLSVWELWSATDTAYRNLWAYLSGIDVTEEIVLRNRPVHEPARWLLTDARTLVMSEQVDFLWLRLLDVPGALTARRYAVPGEVVLEVIDDADGTPGGCAGGRYLLRAGDDEVACDRTQRSAEVTMTQRALASIYLGGFRLRELVACGAAREEATGAIARADLMFSTPLPPWNGTWF